MVVSHSTRRLLISIFPLLLIFAFIIFQASSAIANENIIVRIGADKRRSSLVDEAFALVTQDLTTGITPADLANTLVGNGITVSNVTYVGANSAAGLFSGGAGIIGFDDGIVLSSGDMNDIVGPNIFDSTTTDQNTLGDPDLDILSGFTTLDASILEFDFVPNDSQVFFQFVFASEEYNEFVGEAYNDVFGFFINGQNCALVESDPISLNTVNNGPANQGPGSHSELYRNNDLQNGGGAIDTEADGLTVVLTCNAPVIANSTNHIKLAIADATDATWDSWVFLEAGSLTTVAVCELYPIAIHIDSLIGIAVGDTLPDIYNGAQPGTFGWLSWAGDMSAGALVASLAPPGNSGTYINPNDPSDHLVSVDNWVGGRPGVANSSQVRQALDTLITQDIIMPVWDVAQGTGSNAQYHTVDFAQVRITDYHLPGQNHITAVFQGYASCNSQSVKLDIERLK